MFDYHIKYQDNGKGSVIREFWDDSQMEIKGKVCDTIIVQGREVDIIEIPEISDDLFKEFADDGVMEMFYDKKDLLDVLESLDFDLNQDRTYLELNALIYTPWREIKYYNVNFDFFRYQL